MNIIDLILIAVILLFTVAGIIKGLMYTLLHLAGTVAAAVGAKVLSAPAGAFIYDRFIYGSVHEKLTQMMPSGSVTGELRALTQSAVDQLPDFISRSAKLFGIFPDALTSSDKGTFTVEYFENDVIGPAARTILGVVLMVVLFIVFALFLRIVCYFIDKMLKKGDKHKAAKSINRILGGVLGAVKGIIPSGILGLAVNLIASFTDNAAFLEAAGSSVICTWLSKLIF